MDKHLLQTACVFDFGSMQFIEVQAQVALRVVGHRI